MFEWDTAKANTNLLKHEVSFEEAASAFSDPNGLDGPDFTHSINEVRYLRIAKSTTKRLLTIAYTLRSGKDGQKKIRIISARKASRKEKGSYEKDS